MKLLEGYEQEVINSKQVGEESLGKILKKYLECYKKIIIELNVMDDDDLFEMSPNKPNKKLIPTTRKSLYLKDTARDSTKLGKWIKNHVPKSTHRHLRNSKSSFPFLLITKALEEEEEVYPMPKKLLLKTITDSYNRVLNSKELNLDLVTYLYSIIMNKYGIQSIAERKFLNIISACLIHADCKRIEMFGRFLGLYDIYTHQDFKEYLNMLRVVTSP